MIGYVTVGTNDLEKSAKYYDALLAGIGAKRFMEMDTFIAWSNDPAGCGFSITSPYDGNPASVGNGVMVAIAADSTDKVDALYAKAIELGGTDEGAPGARSDNFYAGYFRDLDGNKLNFFCLT
ncbi:MAG: catechol 2,3-dioxygenase-like lactoylglutathione lyase family enzyme [Kiritimatiellia bacterium]|jgi:catechol 2,3-dioxygenase-like lactoylglutathione lyase family enzyme